MAPENGCMAIIGNPEAAIKEEASKPLQAVIELWLRLVSAESILGTAPIELKQTAIPSSSERE